MLRSSKRPATTSSVVQLSLPELIRSELAGKVAALSHYDHILWKIRAGYLGVVYGTGVLLIGKDSQTFRTAFGQWTVIHAYFLIVVLITFSVLALDWSFLRGKLRVVCARDRLSDLAMQVVRGDSLTRDDYSELVQLLHISGEAPTAPPRELKVEAAKPLVAIYLPAPLAIFALGL